MDSNTEAKFVLLAILVFVVILTIIVISHHRRRSVIGHDIVWHDPSRSWNSNIREDMTKRFSILLHEAEPSLSKQLVAKLSDCIIKRFSVNFHRSHVSEMFRRRQNGQLTPDMYTIYLKCLQRYKKEISKDLKIDFQKRLDKHEQLEGTLNGPFQGNNP